MKSVPDSVCIPSIGSLPAWGEWIEMGVPATGRVSYLKSLPAWGEWIEIGVGFGTLAFGRVSPRMGRVD